MSSNKTFCKCKNMIFALLLAMHLLGTAESGRYEKSSTLIQNLSNQSKHISAHVIKTFQEYNGDIIDCIDIHKQFALTHPLLKSHQVQLYPKSIPQGNSKNISSEVFSKLSECPEGYVPVKRISNDDLVMRKSLKYYKNPRIEASDTIDYYDAVCHLEGKNHGAQGFINVWPVPHVIEQESSAASIIIEDGPSSPDEISSLSSGWMVYPDLFRDNKTRLFTFWIDDLKKSQCYNTLCPGFVQVSRRIYPGVEIHPLSTYEGKQYEILVEIFQDPKTGNWWLDVEDEPVGYWPKTLFTHLQDGAYYSSWGGHVFSPTNKPNPPMGSGRKPAYTNIKRGAYIRQIKTNVNGQLIDPQGARGYANVPTCYSVGYHDNGNSYWGKNVIFGGPGTCD